MIPRNRKTNKKPKGNNNNNVIPGPRPRGSHGTTFNERWMPIFPARKTVSHRYSDSGSLSSTSGVVSSYVFQTNGMYDPNITGTGHSVMGFNQLILSYEHYNVISARCKATFKCTSTNAAPQFALTVCPSSTPVTVIQQIIESGLGQFGTLEIKGVDGSVQMLEAAVDIRKYHGVVDVLDNPNFQGTSVANPSEGSYFILQIWDTSGTTVSVNFDIVIEQVAIWHEPKQLTESLHARIASLIQDDARRKVGLDDIKAAPNRR